VKKVDEDTPLEEEEVKPDRLLAFSDGVFAIAITLLVLNIHIPQINKDLWGALTGADQWKSYLSFLLSFFIIGVVWGNHHTMFSYIKRMNHTLLILNLLFLLDIVVLPFPAGLLALYIGTSEQQTAVSVYTGVWLFGAIIYNLLWWYASHNYRLIDRKLPPEAVSQITRRYLVGPPLSALSFALSFAWNGAPGLILCAVITLFYLVPTVAGRASVSRHMQKGEPGPGQ
jgi:uncharacterized membrane protein